MIRHPLPILATLLCVGAAHAGTGSYSNDFSTAQGTSYGATNHRGEWGTLQLIGDYSRYDGNYHGTWTQGALDRPNATGPINQFSASFKFAFQNNSNGYETGDGFSFLFGDLADLSGSGDFGHGNLQNWQGGEWGLNKFSQQGSGLSVGFKTFGGEQGVQARWGRGYGGNGFSELGSQSDSWLDRVTYGYAGNGPANGQNDIDTSNVTYNNYLNVFGNGGLGAGVSSWEAANTGSAMATAIIEWTAGGDLVISIAMPGESAVEYLRTSSFANITIGENFQFGLTSRVGDATWDVQIDDFNVNYEYSTPVVPGPAAIAGLAGLGLAGRRRRR